MADRYLETFLTPAVRDAQQRAYGRHMVVEGSAPRDPLGPDEAEFIAARDSFYLATVNADGWPYVQHRGGPPGFLRLLDPHTLAFADLRGNRQLITTGNLAGDDRVSLFLMDYPGRTRLKLLGHARAVAPGDDPALVERLAIPAALKARSDRGAPGAARGQARDGSTTEGQRAAALEPLGPTKAMERLVVIDVVSFDWNCPAFITPRYSAAEVEALLAPLRARIEELERET